MKNVSFKALASVTVLLSVAAAIVNLSIPSDAALTKSRTNLNTATTLTASASDTVSSAQNVTTGYSVQVHIKLTNGSTGPTVPAQCQITVAADSAGTLYVNFGGPLVANLGNSVVSSWSIPLNIGVASFKTTCGSNTGQDVTLAADYDMVTAL